MSEVLINYIFKSIVYIYCLVRSEATLYFLILAHNTRFNNSLKTNVRSFMSIFLIMIIYNLLYPSFSLQDKYVFKLLYIYGYSPKINYTNMPRYLQILSSWLLFKSNRKSKTLCLLFAYAKIYKNTYKQFNQKQK